mgnify:CR=1 FL=1
MPLTSIIIPCWNGLEYTRQLIESIEAYTPQEHEIIFVDNGSTDGTGDFLAEYVKAHQNAKVITNPTNHGFPKACNQGLAAARGEYLCLINTDVIVTPEWLTGLIECMEHRPKVGIVGPMTNNISGPQVFPQGKYNSLFKMIEFSRDFRASFKKNYVPFFRIVFFCVLISRECYKKVGHLDERFTPGNFEDDDYCMRAILAGFRTYFTHDVFVHHHGSKSHDMTTYQKRLHINQQKFEAKWREWLKKHNRVSVCTIFRDEEKNIGEYLDRHLPMFDEIIMVDTGSTDRSAEIVKEKMKSWPGRLKLFSFEWCDDFSKARNFAQAQATGDFILSLDVDEWIPQFNKGILWPCTAYLIETRNYSELTVFTNWRANAGDFPDQEKGTGWFPSTKSRLWPNDPEVFFEMPVHEVADRSIYLKGYRVVKTDIPVHHYGKLSIEYDSQKGERYLKLLERLIEENENDIRSVEEIATQLQNLKRYEEAIKYWEKYQTLRDPAVAPDHQVYNTNLNIGHCWYNLGRPDLGLEASKKAMDAKPDSREAACNTAVCHFALKHFNEAFEIAKAVLEKHPEYPTAVAVYNAANEMIERIKRQEETG